MKVIAWSQNLTPEKCEAGRRRPCRQRRPLPPVRLHHHPHRAVAKDARHRRRQGARPDEALRIHHQHLARPIIEEAALLAALHDKKISGAGLDVFDVEPLPLDHPLRKMDNVVITPHLGYVSEQNYRHYFAGVVEDIRGFSTASRCA